jgi:AcrR family transcriptional regulator
MDEVRVPLTGQRTYRGQTSEERARERRARIMEAALDVFAEKGWARAGVKEICAAAGLTDRYLYESWPNTSELFLDVHQAVADRLFHGVLKEVEPLGQDVAPRKFATALVGAFVRGLQADPRVAHMLFVDPGPQDLAPERGETIRRNMLRWATLMEGVATSYLGAGLAGSGRLRFWSLSTVGAFRTTTVEWLAGGLSMSAEELVDALVTLMFEGGRRLAEGADPA